MHLSLPKRFPLFILASSVCWSLQSLISTLTQGGEGGHLFRLTCSVVLGEAGTLQTNITGVCGGSACSFVATVDLPLITVYVLSQSTPLRLQVAVQGNCPKWAWGCMHFLGLSCSGPGSCVLSKGTDLVGPSFYALPRSKELK